MRLGTANMMRPVLSYALASTSLIVYISYLTGLSSASAFNKASANISNEELNDTMGISSEKLLIQHLLRSYQRIGRNGRPVVNISTTVPVTFGLGLIQMDLDEKNKVLTLSAWTRYTWRDFYLMWDPSQYEGITAVRMDPSLVWIPDIMLYNTADVDVASRQAQVIIMNDGTVAWYPHTIFRSSCSIDVANFPFDYQQCHMWFGSWTYSSKELDLSIAFPGGIDLTTFQTDYKETCAWDIINTTSERKVLPEESAEPNFIVLTFEIFMRRKMVFSSYILTLPCVFLACISLVVFWLPPERPDRTSLAMSSFSSFMVLLLILVEACPATASSVPTLVPDMVTLIRPHQADLSLAVLISVSMPNQIRTTQGIYYCFNMVIIMLSIILSSMVVNLSRGTTHKVPKWMRIVVGMVLGRIVFLYSYAPLDWRTRRPPCRTDKSRDHAEMNPIHDSSANDTSCYISERVYVPHTHAHTHTPQANGQQARGPAPPPSSSSLSVSGAAHPTAPASSSATASSSVEGAAATGASSAAPGCCSCMSRRHCAVSDMEGQIGEMRKMVQRIEMKMDDDFRRQSTARDLSAEWRYISLVLDRFFFCVYVALITGSLAMLFPRTS